MRALRISIGLIFLAFAAGVLAQASDSEGRGSPAPGTAQDGSRPSEGAIKGGSMLPGESGGVPAETKTPAARVQRCNELAGTLREDCLAREHDASRGATVAPPAVNRRADPTAPPPQNPR